MEILACVLFNCSRMSYSIGTGLSCGLDGSTCSTGGTIQFDSLPPLVIEAAASSALLWPPSSSIKGTFFLIMVCGKAKTGFFYAGLPSSSGSVALADCPAGIRKIEDGGAAVV